MKKILCTLLVFLTLCALCIPVNAADTDKGSIEIIVKYETTKITGGDLIAVKVGDVDHEKNVFRKVVTKAEITGIGESATVTQMQNFYSAYQNVYKFDVYKTTISNGVGKFTDITEGLYLIYQETAASGYGKLPAFLVTVPYDGEMDVSIASKTELEKDTSGGSGGSGGSGSSGNKKLPQTGQLTWPIPWMAGSGMVLFALGWWLCFGRKEDSQ